ncbi:hypothetical protein SAMD00023353_0901830 [Rosellinia necatrix]|uniref:Uncharacterized protein n=1 Tax=Rosellinia necatrix TaxID=77044 RepID=A0A1S8A6E2_ROSNE|nr:hypothetical protein SAMD00023353_0901830 [Rosellinia necatrix]
MFARPTRQIIAPLRAPMPPFNLFARYRAARQLPRARFSSTQASHEPEPQGSLNHKTFYKTFGRPIAKVFLMAIFMYQLAYYFWVRLEHDEIRAEMNATISDLETRIERLEQAKMQGNR